MDELAQGGKALLDRQVQIVEFTVTSIGDPFAFLFVVHRVQRFARDRDHVDCILLILRVAYA